MPIESNNTLNTFHSYMGMKLGSLITKNKIPFIKISQEEENKLTEAQKLKRLRFLQTHRHLVNGMSYENGITLILCIPTPRY